MPAAYRNIPFDRHAVYRLRTQRMWTQLELARRAGLAELSIQKIELGDQFPKPETIRALAKAFRVPLGALMRPTEEAAA